MWIVNAVGALGLFAAVAILQQPAGQKPQQNPPSKAPAAQAGAAQDVDLFEDRSVVLIGRIAHKNGQFVLRVKEFGNFAGGAGAAGAGAAGGTAGGEAPQGKNEGALGQQQKRRTGKARTLRLDDEVTLLKSSMLEDIEEDVGLKHVESKGQESDLGPLMQVQGILTMYKNEPHIFIQAYRTRTEGDRKGP